MFKMNKIALRVLHLSSALAVAATLMLTACHDDVEMPIDTRPSVVEEEDVTVTSFTLSSDHFQIPEGTEEVTIALTPVDEVPLCFAAKVQREDDSLRFHMSIPAPETIADGTYIMTMSHNDGKTIPGRLSVLFENGLLSSVKIVIPTYMLDGSGTEEDPYLIKNDDDFMTFLINLGDDKDVYGAGLVFKQTADVNAPDQSPFISGRGYWGAPFAGIYDGGGHEIKGMYYHGTRREDSDSYFGLFTELRGSASISHLKVTGVTVSGLYKWCGIIAAFTTGNVSLTDITVSGVISDATGLGGLVGVLKSGTLTIDDVKLQAVVEGADDTGGLVGYTEKSTTLNVSRVSTPDSHFSVSGGWSVGGIVGRTKGTANISDVRLEHKVSAEDSDIKIIKSSVGQLGGIIGQVQSANGDQNLTRCYVVCPVGGDSDYIGGIIGRIYTTKTVNLNECRFCSVLTGANYVGGLAGYVKFDMMGPGTFHINGQNLSTRVATDDADAKISGRDYVGGCIGYFYGGSFYNYCDVKVNIPVSGSGSCVGGVFGKVQEISIELSRFIMGPGESGGDTTMKVSGENRVGGMVGELESARLTGNQHFDYGKAVDDIVVVPNKRRFTPVYSGVVTGKEYVGGLLGYGFNATITGLSSAASVTGDKYVGGVAGHILNTQPGSHNTLEDITFSGTLNCPKADCVGGIAGSYGGHYGAAAQDCINYSEIIGGDCTGGVFGYVVMEGYGGDTVEVNWCSNIAPVTGTYNVGGIVGRSYVEFDPQSVSLDEAVLIIADCANSGNIKASGGNDKCGVGGVVGNTNYVTGVMRCVNNGDIYGSGQFHGIGGIAGSMGDDPTGAGLTHKYLNVILSECFNIGDIDAGNRSSFVGGILGYLEEGKMSTVENCKNSGRVVPDQNHDCGGIVGCVDHLTDIYRCVNKGKVEHGNAAIGTHKSGSSFDHGALYYLEGTGKGWPSATSVSTSAFDRESSFGGLDFTNVWDINGSGPFLRNNKWMNFMIEY